MKKGFTLAELLGVIVVIGLLLLIIIPLVINGVSSREDEVEGLQNDIIFDATDEFLDSDSIKYPNVSGNVYCVSIGQLLETGKLVDPVKKIVEEGNYGDDDVVEIKITNNGVRNYKLVSSGECKAQSTDDIMITVSPDNSQWSQEKKVVITYPTLDSGVKNQYTRDDGNTWVSVGSKEIELTYTQEGTIGADVIDNNGQQLTKVTEKIEKIDRENPVILQITEGDWNDDLEQQVNITMTDAKSGVNAYMISTSATKPSENDKNWVDYELSPYGGTGTISQSLPIGTYYVYVKDRAGNITEPDSNNIIEIKDSFIPTCKITLTGTLGNSPWYRSNVGLVLSFDDKGSGVASYGLTTNDTPTYNSQTTATQTADTKSTKYYGYVKDKAGNTGMCSIDVAKDATKPTLSNVTKGGTWNKWTNKKATLTAKGSDATSGMENIYYRYSTSGTNYSNWLSGSTSTSISGSWSSNINKTIYLAGVDKAGNEQVQKVGTLKIDVTPPYSPKLGKLSSSKITVTKNTCNSAGKQSKNTTCDVYFTTYRYCTYSFDISSSGTDAGGSGINKVQYTWTHNGTADKHSSWTDDDDTDDWDWRATTPNGQNTATWIKWGIRYVDNAGNVGYSMIINFHISYKSGSC